MITIRRLSSTTIDTLYYNILINKNEKTPVPPSQYKKCYYYEKQDSTIFQYNMRNTPPFTLHIILCSRKRIIKKERQHQSHVSKKKTQIFFFLAAIFKTKIGYIDLLHYIISVLTRLPKIPPGTEGKLNSSKVP